MIAIADRRFATILCWLAAGSIAAAATTAAAEREGEEPTAATRAERPNVLVIVTDDQRPDTIAALGNPVIRTPNLDELVRTGATFTRAICANPICTPSRAELLTGCSGFRNGVLDFGGKIDPRRIAWATTMRQAGYRTCYVGKWHNDGRPSTHGYDACRGLFAGGGGRWATPQRDYRGCEVTGYRGWVFQSDGGEKFPELGVGLTADISSRFAEAAVQCIRDSRDAEGKPFFLHVTFMSPRDPLLMPPGYEKRYAPEQTPLPENFGPRHPFDHGNLLGRDEQLLPWPRTAELVRADLAAYYAVISHLDAQIGRILRALQETGQSDRTIIVFTSDNGLAVGSHGLRGKQNMYEHTIGVPLIFRGPGIPAGRRFAAQAYLRDLYPTVCDLIGTPIPDSVTGSSLKPILSGRAEEIHPQVFGYFRDAQRMIRTDRWKLIHYPHLRRYQLFDLQNDPWELRDLSGDASHRRIQEDLQARLAAWQRASGDPLVTK